MGNNINSMLSILNEKCADSSFYVLEYGDFADDKRVRLDRAEMLKQILYLRDRGFIKISYASEDEYCIAVQPKGRINDMVDEQVQTVVNYKLMAKYAFLGGLIGGGVVGIIMTIILLILR